MAVFQNLRIWKVFLTSAISNKRFSGKCIHSYIICQTLTVLSIAPLNPLGIPHQSLADDTYNGMFIPKGSIVYQNVYAMHRDPKVYSDPENFDPDRYIPKEKGGKGEPLPYGNFGFGRR